MILIFVFAVACIFGSLFVREIDSSNFFSQFLDYTVSFENRFYDFRMKSLLNPKFKSKEIVLVKIDDDSLQKLGVWPIPRTIHAKMIDKLRVFGAKSVGLDIIFPEKSPLYGEELPDEILAKAIKKFQQNGRRIFVAYTTTTNPNESLKEAPLEMLNDAILTRTVPDSDLRPMFLSRFTFPIEELVSTEVGLGNISAWEDPDGIFRHYQLISNIDSIYYGSLALNVFEAFKEEKYTINIFADRTGELIVENTKLEINFNGETRIRYIGSEDEFESVSLYDLISAKDSDEKMKNFFQGKMVFVGSTALGAHDLRPSPIDAKMPGVYSHMNVAHMLNNNYVFQSSNESVKYSILFLCIGMALFILVQHFGNAFLDAGVIILVILSYHFFDKYYFMPQGYELKLFYSFFCLMACYSWNTFLKFYEANKEKKQIKGTFARYVAPTVVDEMLKNPDKLHVGGTKMDITCLFSDVRDFTKISENLSASELSESLNLYMGAMTDIIFETKGTLDKYIGDAIVALWGAPLPVGNHAQLAVEGAIRMLNKLPSINEEFKKNGKPEFKIGIGLNSGECSVGNMGSERIFSYTALGDNMNLGSRLEALCKHYGAYILISDMTLERIDHSLFQIRPIDKVIVKGKTKAVGIHEVLHDHHWMKKNTHAFSIYLKAYETFINRDFNNALELFQKVRSLNETDRPTERLIHLCQNYLQNPQNVNEYFDVTVMSEK